MANINLYKIEESKKQTFLEAISQKLNRVNTIDINSDSSGQELIFKMSLYMPHQLATNEVCWNWILTAFEQPPVYNQSNHRAILLIEKDEYVYAITFGTTYFIVDKYCDRNFAFTFARKLDYKGIRTTALTSPNSQRNKVINSYIDNNNLEFDSGESFTKIKARVAIDENFLLYKEAIEIGSSIKFSLANDSLGSIAELIVHIEHVLHNIDDKYKIPVFSKVGDENRIQILNQNLLAATQRNPLSITISEFDVVGAVEVFNHNDSTFKIIARPYEKNVSELNYHELEQFANENNFSLNERLFEIKVVSYVDGNSIKTESLRNLLDYTDEAERCLLSRGQWYQYNDDYLSYLSDSLSEIEVIYEPNYNFSRSNRQLFLENKFNEERQREEYVGKSETEIRKNVDNKYYAERYYNIMMEVNHGFRNFDRVERRIGSADIELMDLYKDNTMYAVKKGRSSEKLCYVVDQSLQALKAYKHNLTENKPIINNVAILLILERVNQLPTVHGKPNINVLDMLMLKNKFDFWKKEVRVLGYKPIIYINYVVD